MKKKLFSILVLSTAMLMTACDTGTSGEDSSSTVSTSSESTSSVTPVVGITVTSQGNLTSIEEGQTLQLSAVCTPSEASQNVTWSTSSSTVATVSSTGLVTAVGKGNVVISATSVDYPSIKGNFNFDDAGQPLSTAAGNMPDIECDYGDFSLSVEVTLQSGQRQYESEGEPVARHYGQLKKRVGKETYCLFIAPTINAATLAHFYGLNHLSIALYGGKSKIIPLELDQFMKLIESAYNHETQPTPADIRMFLDNTLHLCNKAIDENNWKCAIQTCVDMWLAS